jgi:hypothetical protein
MRSFWWFWILGLALLDVLVAKHYYEAYTSAREFLTRLDTSESEKLIFMFSWRAFNAGIFSFLLCHWLVFGFVVRQKTKVLVNGVQN